MKSILAAVDFSEATPRLLNLARDLARWSGAKLWVVHVAAPDPDFVGFETGPQYIRDHRAHQLREEHAQLQAMAAEARSGGIDAEALLIQGPTAETILSEAARLNAQLVVLGSHGRGALYRTFVGSVSEQVLGESRVPVLVVPSKQR